MTSVEHDTGRSGLRSGSKSRGRDGNDQRAAILLRRERITVAVVERGSTGIIVADPKRAATRGAREPPRILQVRVGNRSHAHDVGHQVRLLVMLGKAGCWEQERREKRNGK